MNKTQKKLLGKTADILDALAEKCGGPGGKPGPCPSGVAGKPDAVGSDSLAKKAKAATDEAANLSENLAQNLKNKTNARIMSTWADSTKVSRRSRHRETSKRR